MEVVSDNDGGLKIARTGNPNYSLERIDRYRMVCCMFGMQIFVCRSGVSGMPYVIANQDDLVPFSPRFLVLVGSNDRLFSTP